MTVETAAACRAIHATRDHLVAGEPERVPFLAERLADELGADQALVMTLAVAACTAQMLDAAIGAGSFAALADRHSWDAIVSHLRPGAEPPAPDHGGGRPGD